ncbi:hypothetical protein ALC57_05597 [Trachymyrmex cornetzi]|uniref:Uncharacterized protein n=1 Tax=Trachymyrmex cornetzi TaxID=471704 RepID=A0A151JAD6_9HYME|nr:hypothetical protein ALC57_05597 [Trachymyrmex cornetzi]
MSRCSTFNMDIEYVILPKITQNLPLVEVCVTNLDIPKDIKLADPHFNTPSKIDMLIGAEKFWELIGTGQIRLGKYKPVLQESSLGWLISGPISLSQSNKGSSTSCHLSTIDELNQSVKRFWEIEDYTNAKNTDAEEEYCERLFKASYKRTTEGRFVVKLPVKEKILPLLENSRKVAVNRFLALERKFARQPEFKAEYVAFMREYQQLGHMRASNISLGNKFSCCCILQNFVESRNEQFFQQWLNDVVEAEIIYPQPVNVINKERDDISGSTIRKYLTNYLCNNFPLRASVLR